MTNGASTFTTAAKAWGILANITGDYIKIHTDRVRIEKVHAAPTQSHEKNLPESIELHSAAIS